MAAVMNTVELTAFWEDITAQRNKGADFIQVHMTGNTVCNLFIDTGADISLFKACNIHPDQPVYINNKIKLTGITENSIETLGVVNTTLCFINSLVLNQDFHLVTSDLPIKADGILGRDFLVNYKCVIDYDTERKFLSILQTESTQIKKKKKNSTTFIH